MNIADWTKDGDGIAYQTCGNCRAIWYFQRMDAEGSRGIIITKHAKQGPEYFLVSKQGPCWDHIVATRRVGAYVPGEFTDPDIELLVVLDS